jgi:hypothetical protein
MASVNDVSGRANELSYRSVRNFTAALLQTKLISFSSAEPLAALLSGHVDEYWVISPTTAVESRSA